ncbi:MAG TPA: hypothetical protein VEC39_12150 [Vicinamibacterales bacterium]|nr:hypothetical protein [Vicinamibacterales bacterium]
MTKYFSASLAVFAILSVGCERVDTAEPSAAAGSAEQKPSATAPKPAPANESAGKMPAPPPPLTQNADGANAQGAATLEFKKRLDAYVKIHKEADSKVDSLKRTDDPKEISDREKALQQMIMTLRANAKQGEIFAPEYQPYFVQIVKEDFKTRSAADRKALINELPKHMKVDVNTPYPTTIPLATFPPALLRKLPDLPPELEYRLVGRSLILRDVKANLIVDVLRDFVPTIPS